MPIFRPLLSAAFAVAGFALTLGAAQAQTIEAVAVSRDGGTVLVGAGNRTVYAVNADTLEVKSRHYIPRKVKDIIYSADGTQVFFRDEADRLEARDAQSLAVQWTIEDVDAVDYAPGVNVIAALDQNFKDDSVRLINPVTGEQLKRIAMGKMRANLLALNADATKAMILTNSQKSDAEEKAKEPADLSKLAKADFKQKHDGYTSQVISVDFEAGTFEASETYYRVSFPKELRIAGGNLQILRSNYDSALVGPKGSTALIDLGEKFFNWIMMDKSGETYILSNGVELRLVPVAGGAAVGLLSGERLPRGAPGEWVTASAEADDGSLYFATNAYRLLKVPANRGSVEISPIR